MFQPNSVIAGRYQVIRLVGQGGMSNLYLAHDRKYGNAIVVVKEMTAAYSDPKEQQMAVELFHREAKLLASLNHRHIPKVYDYFQFAGKYYLSMEFIDGEDLAQKLEATKGPLPEAQVLEWGEQIATVLFYLHKHEPPIVFRDVKPSNIMLCEQGVKLIDFGIARHFDQAKKGDTMRIGSPGYAPPEQYAAQTDPRSDIYALGVTLHHALTGRDPTSTQTPFLVPPARNINPALSEATAAMLARATQLSPEDRYQNILEMKNDIKQILSRGKQSTRVVGAPPPPPGPAVAPTTTPAAAAVAAVVAAAAANTTVAAQSAQTAASVTTATQSASGVLASTAVVVNPPANALAAKKTGRGKGLLLVAAVLLLVGGGLFAAGPSGRQAVLSKAKMMVSSMLAHGHDSSKPEDAIRDIIQKGDPRALLPLFSDAGLAALSEDKKALYRLNLLAAGASAAPPGIVHLLYPEEMADGPGEESLFRGAARALAAVNGGGGLDKQLLVVLPRTYEAGRLDTMIAKVSTEEAKGGQRLLLILDSQAQKAGLSPESRAQRPFVVSDLSPGADLPWLPTLQPAKDLASQFSLDNLDRSGKLLWGAASDPPAAGKAEKVEFSDSVESLNRLLGRSSVEGATLVVEASRLVGIEGLSSEGKLLVLAVGPAELPELSPNLKAEAMVLGSPLREGSPKTSGAHLFLSPSTGLTLGQARIFDAVLLTAWPSLLGDYSGITVTRAPKSKDLPGVPIRYRWTALGWVPALQDK